ncbi:phosphoenolpyruvate synthase [Candidatus Pacearchaeota archaeon]|nr:phosphoenolpyruvate synthase [Candidatus Pacearchaeota archaeon]
MGKEEVVGFVKWFSELRNKDIPIAGGKGASLAEMYNSKIPVPPGFIVTAQAYSHFINKTGIGGKIKNVFENLNVDDTSALHKAAKKIREIIENQEMPQEMKDEIVESYEVLGVRHEEGDALKSVEKSEESFVAVRSSATTEDLADASFAGQQESFLNVRGKEDLLDKVKKCMSSLFTPRAIFYREKKGFDHSKSYLAVVVQKMIDSEKSGVIFSQNPTRNDGRIIIESVWGLGEGIVSGRIKPDHYEVNGDLDNFKIEKVEVNLKKIAIIRNEEGENEEIKLRNEQSKKRVLDNYEIKRLAQFARQLEEHYKKPQDIEFAIDESGISIVQSRPITTIAKESEGEIEGNVLLSGLGASPGISSGPVKIVREMSDLEKIQQGDVLVAEMTNPDMVVAMQKSAGIVTDEGGVTSHAAIVSREMGIPAVVGTGDATSKLKEGDIVTVDGSHGKVIEGKSETRLVKIEPIVPTKTEIKVIVDMPLAAERAAKSKAKKIGLTRLEGIIASSGKHPMKFVKEKKMDEYKDLIAEGIKGIINYFDEMWIRTSDLRSDEYRELEGAPKEVEGNPMLGDHGIRFSLKHPEIMKAELEAIKEAAHESPHKKFGIMMPQIISVDEVIKTKELAKEIGIPKNIHIGIMVETPAAVQIIEDICKEGISFISFGTNDLTQYTLAIDRNNENVQNLFDETHPAIVNSIKHVIAVCKKYGVETSICGQAGSKPEMARILVESGINSISVNADAAKDISEVVATVEKKVFRFASGEEVQSQERVGDEEEEDVEENEEVEEIDVPKKEEGIFTDKDIEEAALAALGDDYNPGKPNGNNEFPSLNEAIPVDSESFEEE